VKKNNVEQHENNMRENYDFSKGVRGNNNEAYRKGHIFNF
jgi:hypothetical protein